MTIERRVWIRSGIVEELDERQQRLMRLVLEKIKFYYERLYRTRPCFRHPLSLSRLMQLSNRSSAAVMTAIRYLAHTVPFGSDAEPPIYYDRSKSQRNKTHRPYRIFLRHESMTQYITK
jgi:hypothetical protein